MCVSIYVCIYIYTDPCYVALHVYIYIYIYIYKAFLQMLLIKYV